MEKQFMQQIYVLFLKLFLQPFLFFVVKIAPNEGEEDNQEYQQEEEYEGEEGYDPDQQNY